MTRPNQDFDRGRATRRISRQLERIARAIEAHADQMLPGSMAEDPEPQLNPFVPVLSRARARHRDAARRLRSLSSAIADRGLDAGRADAVTSVLRGIRLDHAREGDVLWRSVVEDVGVCD